MLLFDISDTSIEVARLGRRFFAGEAIVASARVELTDGSVKMGEVRNKDALCKTVADLLRNVKPRVTEDQECAFTLSDSRVYTRRFKLPQVQDHQTVLGLVKEKAEKLFPQPAQELIYQFDSLERGEGAGEIFLMAASRDIVLSYVDVFNSLGLQSKLAVPESYAACRFIAPIIGKKEVTLYLDIGGKYTNVVLVDSRGVLETFSEPVETAELFSEIEKLLKFLHKKLEQSVGRVILGGGGSLELNLVEAKERLKIDTILVEEAFKHFPLSIRNDFGGLPKVLFVNVLGLALLTKEKSPLSFFP